jgi:hypothetical protein
VKRKEATDALILPFFSLKIQCNGSMVCKRGTLAKKCSQQFEKSKNGA